MSKGISSIAAVGMVILVFVIGGIFLQYSNSLFSSLATVSGPIVDITFDSTPSSQKSFEIVGSMTDDKTIVIHNDGDEPFSIGDIDIEVGGDEAAIVTPNQDVQPGESIVLIFDTDKTGVFDITVSIGGGPSLDYVTTITGLDANPIPSTLSGGYCGDGVCNPHRGENCRNCFTDCSMCG